MLKKTVAQGTNYQTLKSENHKTIILVSRLIEKTITSLNKRLSYYLTNKQTLKSRRLWQGLKYPLIVSRDVKNGIQIR